MSFSGPDFRKESLRVWSVVSFARQIDVAGRQRAGALGRAQSGQRGQVAVRRCRTRARNWIGARFGGGAPRAAAPSAAGGRTLATSRAWPAMRASRAFSTRSASAIGSPAGPRQLRHARRTRAGLLPVSIFLSGFTPS